MLGSLLLLVVGYVLGQVFPGIGLPEKFTLFEAVSYFSMAYFVVDYIVPKCADLFVMSCASAEKALKAYFKLESRFFELRDESRRARQPSGAPALAHTPVRE